jgi:hypothetical protein
MIERKKVQNFLKNINLRSKKEVREQVLADKNIYKDQCSAANFYKYGTVYH